MRRIISILTVLTLVAVLALAVVACGSDDDGDIGAAPSPTASAEQLVQQSLEATGKAESASFVADMTLKAEGDPSQMDPSTQAMTDLSVHAEGKGAKSPMAADMTMSLGIAGQTMEFAMMAQDDKAWIQYQGKWYEIDQKTAQGLGVQASPSAAPDEQLKGMGLDPEAWGAAYELVGTEQMDGTWVHHVKATVDPQKLADSLLDVANDPSMLKQLGQAGVGKELRETLKEDKAEIRELGDSLKNTSADFWIGADDMLMRKATLTMNMDMTGQKDSQGVDTMAMAGSLRLSEFGEDVSVTPPADALPFSELMSSFFGGMFGGMGGGMGGGDSLSF